jgi:predicted Zn-dependent peptidase
MQYFIHQFTNGIRLIHYPVNSPVAHCAILVNTGSRDELPEEHGLAHFVEHTLFKGTTHRKPWHIISALEDVGGDLNAYTTKEETCVHASFMKEDFARAFDLLSDLIFRATFPEKEIEKEKEIVLDEINSYLDSPSELILDSFEELIYNDNPLGRSILGRTETVRQFTRSKIIAFLERTYHTDQMVVAAAGDIDSRKLVRLAESIWHPPST